MSKHYDYAKSQYITAQERIQYCGHSCDHALLGEYNALKKRMAPIFAQAEVKLLKATQNLFIPIMAQSIRIHHIWSRYTHPYKMSADFTKIRGKYTVVSRGVTSKYLAQVPTKLLPVANPGRYYCIIPTAFTQYADIHTLPYALCNEAGWKLLPSSIFTNATPVALPPKEVTEAVLHALEAKYPSKQKSTPVEAADTILNFI